MREQLAARTTAEWLEVFEKADIPATPLHTLESIFDDPHLNAVGFFQTTEHPTEGPLRTVRGPVGWSRRLRPPAAAPQLGEHTVDVLVELGFDQDDAAKIKREGGGECPG